MSQDKIFDVCLAFGVIVLKKMLLFRKRCFVLDLYLSDLLGHVTLLGQGYWGEWPGAQAYTWNLTSWLPKYLLMCICAHLHVCMIMCICKSPEAKRMSCSLELELQVVKSHHVHAGNRIQVLCKRSRHSHPQSHVSSPITSF